MAVYGVNQSGNVRSIESQQQTQLRHQQLQQGQPLGPWENVTLNRLSHYHPLSTNHVRVPMTTPAMFARLQRALVVLGVESRFDANGSADVRTREGVEFRISAFSPRNLNVGEAVFEIDRIAGDAFTFHQQYTRPLYDAIQGNQNFDLDQDVFPREMTQEVAAQIVASSTRQDVPQAGIDQSIAAIDNRAQSPVGDARRLALDSLTSFTDISSDQVTLSLAQILSIQESIVGRGVPNAGNIQNLVTGTIQTFAQIFQGQGVGNLGVQATLNALESLHGSLEAREYFSEPLQRPMIELGDHIRDPQFLSALLTIAGNSNTDPGNARLSMLALNSLSLLMKDNAVSARLWANPNTRQLSQDLQEMVRTSPMPVSPEFSEAIDRYSLAVIVNWQSDLYQALLGRLDATTNTNAGGDA